MSHSSLNKTTESESVFLVISLMETEESIGGWIDPWLSFHDSSSFMRHKIVKMSCNCKMLTTHWLQTDWDGAQWRNLLFCICRTFSMGSNRSPRLCHRKIGSDPIWVQKPFFFPSIVSYFVSVCIDTQCAMAQLSQCHGLEIWHIDCAVLPVSTCKMLTIMQWKGWKKLTLI